MDKKQQSVFDHYIEGFRHCVMASFDNKDFVSNWKRLRNRGLVDREDMLLFISDVKDLVWDRLQR